MPIVAGAVLSVAYFGDKMSPLSDTTNPAAAGGFGIGVSENSSRSRYHHGDHRRGHFGHDPCRETPSATCWAPHTVASPATPGLNR
jgi:hypothetical protein